MAEGLEEVVVAVSAKQNTESAKPKKKELKVLQTLNFS